MMSFLNFPFMQKNKQIYRILIAISLFLFLNINISAQIAQSAGNMIDEKDFSERSSCISWDGRKMVLVSNKDGKFKLYLSLRADDNSWLAPTPINVVNNFGDGNIDLDGVSFNFDGTVIYFGAKFNANEEFDIYTSSFQAGVWTAPINLGAPINTAGLEAQPSISPNDKSLYFTRKNDDSDDKTGRCKTIFVAERNDTGGWETPYRLPNPINNTCESSPRIAKDNVTLIYSSIRSDDEKKKDFDLYYTKRLAQNVWYPPIPMDTLNSKQDDLAPNFSGDDELYFSRSIWKNPSPTSLMKAELLIQYRPQKTVILKGKISDLATNEAIAATVRVVDPNTARLINEYKNNSETGEYQIILPKGKKYQIDVSKEGYSHEIFTYDAEKIRKSIEKERNVTLYSKVNVIFNITDEEIFKPLTANLDVIDFETGTKEYVVISKEYDGRYIVALPIGKKYRINVSKDYYDSTFLYFDLRGIVQFSEFEKDIEIKAQKREMVLDIVGDSTSTEMEILITNINSNEKMLVKASKNEKGEYVIQLREGEKYNINVSAKGYSFYNTSVDLNETENKPIANKIKVEVTKLKSDEKIELKAIVFEVNSAELSVSSFGELEYVAKLMKENTEIRIEIAAHTDNAGSDAYNLKLSNLRATSVLDFLLEKEIVESRLVAKGYGESDPIYPNDTDENKAKNRRVELRIIEI